jgi:hypothetical protein
MLCLTGSVILKTVLEIFVGKAFKVTPAAIKVATSALSKERHGLGIWLGVHPTVLY